MGLARRAAAFQWLRSKVRKIRCIDAQRYFARFPHPGNLPRASRFSSPEPSTNLAVIGTTPACPLSRGVVSARTPLHHSDSGTAPLFHCTKRKRKTLVDGRVTFGPSVACTVSAGFSLLVEGGTVLGGCFGVEYAFVTINCPRH